MARKDLPTITGNHTPGAPLLPPQTLAILAECRGRGMPQKDACAVAGVSTSYFCEHHRKGLADIQNGKPDTDDARFAQALEKAEADRLGALLDIIRKAGDGLTEVTKTVTVEGGPHGPITTTEVKQVPPQWAAAAWLIERTRPEFQLHKTEEEAVESEVASTPGAGFTKEEARAAGKAILALRRAQRHALRGAIDVTPKAD